MATDAKASERGRTAIQALAEAGERLDLKIQLEFPILGGRIDVVWLWEGPDWFPVTLPVVGFEVESSWRTRKHIKGDFLNLVDLQPSLGVIVLLGEDAKVESTRRFTQELVHRHAARIEVWSEDDVRRLGSSSAEVLSHMLGQSPMQTSPTAEEKPPKHIGKYRALSEWLARHQSDSIPVTFSEIEEILGFPLPPSSRKHSAHWSGYEGSAVARAIYDAGWRATNVNLNSESLTFRRHT